MTQELAPQRSRFRTFLEGKTRILAAWVLCFALVFFVKPAPWLPGILVVFLGALLRFFASAYLRKDSALSIGGPYVWTRNPLYFGTYLMAVGAAMAVQSLVFFLVVSVVFAGIYHFIILDEETKLAGFFGENYQKYCSAIPRFFPLPPTSKRLAKVADLPRLEFSQDLLIKNKAWEPFVVFFAIWGGIALIGALRFLGSNPQ